MDYQNQQNSSEQINKPPYQQISFVHTYTIGVKNNNNNLQKSSNYQWYYKDILIPKAMNYFQQPLLYYFFHVHGIYNWLRSLQDIQSSQRKQLNEYIKINFNIDLKSIITLNIDHNSIQNKNKVKANPKDILNFSFQYLLKDYIKKWEVVKLSQSVKIYIKSLKKNNKNQECIHLSKTNQWINHDNYQYNERDKKFFVKQVFCNNCEKYLEGDFVIEKYPIAPIFKQFFGNSIQIDKSVYFLSMVFSISASNQLLIYIKNANNAWYQIQFSLLKQTKGKQRLINFDKINIKAGAYFIYMKVQKNKNQILKAAQPFKIKAQDSLLKQNCNSNRNKTLSINKFFDKSKKNEIKNVQTQDKQIYINKSEKDTKKTKKNQIKQQQQLSSLQKNMNQIALPKYSKYLQKYQQIINPLFNKPKQKDQYDKQYDKGKTKKIKKKIEYIKPNFNEIYKKVKQEENNRQKEKFYSQYQKQQYGFKNDTQHQKKRKQWKDKNKFDNKKNNKSKKFNNYKEFNKNK